MTGLTAILAAILALTTALSPHLDRYFPGAVFVFTALYLVLWCRSATALRYAAPMLALTLAALWSWIPPALSAPRWTAYAVLAFVVTQLFASARLRHLFTQVSILCGAVAALVVTIEVLGSDRIPGEALAVLSNRNHFAALMELLLPLAAWEFAKARRPVYAAAAGVMFLSVVMSASRMGILLTFGELVLLGFAAARRFRAIPVKTLAVTAAVVVVATAALGTTAWQRFANLSYDLENSTRAYTAKASLAMIRERPLFGFGLGTWASVYPRFAEIDTGFDLIHADDDWLEFTAEGGLPFLGILLFVAACAVKNAWHEPWSIGLIAVLVHGTVEFPLQKLAVMAWFVVLLAMSSMARRQHAS